ncbi:MAG TPA: amino acid adenylation domain-containing protein, partial [Pyrinomonadaceae bacterium]|nr:amino acid adenylation domain-containing protein [Pyrinomonadaceae bacterium]
MKANNVADIYRLSPMQEGMLFHALYTPGADAYFRQLSYRLEGALDLAAFERAWQQVLERHAALRTSFYWQDLEKPLQVVQQKTPVPLEVLDWKNLSADEQRERFAALLETEKNRPFKLAQAPLMRLVLVELGGDAFYFVWSYHHLLLDGWSKYLVLKEVFELYDAALDGRAARLVPARPYKDYIAWLRRQDKTEAEKFWQRTLRGFRTPTPLPAAAPAKGDATETEVVYGEEGFELSVETTAALKSLARQHQLTLNTLVQGAWALLLSRYHDEETVLFGVTVSGRPASLAGVEEMVGLFINTLPLRLEVPPDLSLLEWLKAIQAQQLELNQYEYSALVEIQGFSEVPRGLPLFESLVVFDNYPVAASLRTQGGLKYTRLATVERNNYPLTLVALADEQLHLRIPFDESRFTAETVRRMLGHLQTLLCNFAHAPSRTLAQIELLTGEERQQLLCDWNRTEDGATLDECLPEIFARQAEATPDSTAVIFGEASLTYRELNERANRLAHHLRGLGVGAEVRVGVCAERSLDTVTAILGILKAGGVYVPLAPNLPPERLSYMLEDLQVPVLITEQHLLWGLPPYAAASEVVCLDSDWMTIAEQPCDDPCVETSGDNLAYIIYTSGSTGQPKGVCITHAAAANHFLNVRRNFALDEHDRMLQFASLSFDVSLEQIFAPLLVGAAVVLRENETWGRDDFYREARRHGLTVVNFPPAYWREILEGSGTDHREGLAEQLKLIIIGGDAIAPQLIRLWQQSPFNQLRLLNAYGPTETIITATVSDISASTAAADDPAQTPQVTIGRPLVNRKIHILDRHGSPVPIGVAGELYIGGPLLARGYLNQPELTAERFLPDPFGAVGGRLYRTGDRARFLSDGSIEYLGRVDYQVKVRGFRIELGEVEAALAAHPQVNEAVVVAREDEAGDKRLVAYLVADQATTSPVEIGELRAFLKEQLPDYMIPAHYVWLENFPLTPNGKIDRKALPAPDHSESTAATGYLAPRTPVQEILVGIWEEVLKVERIGITDNFFELGGHSLLATQLVSRVREAFGVEVPLRTLFEEPTVTALATAVETALRVDVEPGTETESAPPPLVRFEQPPGEEQTEQRELPLSYAQQRLWFIDQLEPESAAYNIPAAVRLMGALDVSSLERAIGEVVRRHEVLRTTFAMRAGEPVQVVHEGQAITLGVTDISHLVREEREREAGRLAAREAARPFNLGVWPLVRAELLKMGEDEHVLLLTMHHIVSDGWSFSVLIKEVATLYAAYVKGEESPLEELPVQYADYARWQREWLTGEVLDRQVAYWREQLSDAPETLELPTDRVRPAMPSYRGASARFTLPEALSAQLQTMCRREGVTLYMLLLAAFQTLLSKYSGQEEVVVGSPIAGRTRREVEGLIGFFVNTLALRGDLRGDPSFREVLRRVREACLGA